LDATAGNIFQIKDLRFARQPRFLNPAGRAAGLKNLFPKFSTLNPEGMNPFPWW